MGEMWFLNSDLPERGIGFIAKEHREGYAEKKVVKGLLTL